MRNETRHRRAGGERFFKTLLSSEFRHLYVGIGEWLMIVSTVKGSGFLLQQVTSTTTGLVRTDNYTFWRNGRSFSPKQKSLTACPATTREIEAWLSGRKKPETQKAPEPREEVTLARYLASVREDEWVRLGAEAVHNQRPFAR